MHSFRRLVILGCILLGYVYQVERVRPVFFFGQFQDDSIYFTTAKALADGQGYKLVSFPGSPPETKYPIVYSWLLSFVWKLNPNFPDNLRLAIHLTEFFGCWCLIAVFFLLRSLSDIGESAALCLTAVCALQPVFLRTSGLVMSDLPFMACMLTVLALCVSANSTRSGPWMYVLIGMLAGLSVGIRTVGVSLVAGICCAFILRKAFRPALVIAAAASFTMLLVMSPTLFHRVAPLSLGASGEPGWDQVAAYYTSYAKFQWGMGVPSVGALLHLVLLNLFVLASSPGPILVGTFGKIGAYGAMVLSFPMWVGLLRQSRHSEWKLVTFTMLFYGCVILVWPYPQPERFLLPFIPVLLSGLWCETRRIGALLIARLRPGRPVVQRIFAGVLACFLLCLFGMAAWNSVVRDPRARRVAADSQAAALEERKEAYQWIRDHTSPGDRVAAWKDVVLYLYTGRQSLRPIATLPQAFYAEDLKSEKDDLAHICDAPRHVGVRYWMTTTDDFNLEPHRDRFAARMAEVGRVLPIVFRSSGGNVQIHDASCLNEQERPACRAIGQILFPK